MSEWGRSLYGDPCRQCGFSWPVSREEARATVTAAVHEMATMLDGADGSARHPELSWPVVGYVCHVADNLRIWAERLVGLAAGDTRPVARYDPDLLARARNYDRMALAGALWTLHWAATEWVEAVARADEAGITLVHPDRGQQSLLDVMRSNAHDARHHCWDVARTLAVARLGGD